MKYMSYLFQERYQSLTALLNEFEVPLSTRKANQILVKEGILLELVRPSLIDPDINRTFKIFSAKGLRYGKNVASEVHPIHTFTLYCRANFPYLITRVFSKYINLDTAEGRQGTSINAKALLSGGKSKKHECHGIAQ